MKQLYEKPWADLIVISTRDVITASSGGIDNEIPDEENPFI